LKAKRFYKKKTNIQWRSKGRAKANNPWVAGLGSASTYLAVI